MKQDQSQIAEREHAVITGSVTSKDGTSIGYRQLGHHGPGLAILHGAMETSKSHMQLAEAMADTFTIYMPDRRGRGLSGPHSKEYSIQKEVEDLEALLIKTDTHYVFGVSAGGVICLQSALTLPTIQKAALYEPALSVNGSISTFFLKRYDKEMAQGRLASALVTGMKGAKMGLPIFNIMPRWLLELLTSMAMKSEDKKARVGDVTMRMLAPTLHYDFQLVSESEEALDNFKSIRAETLLLGGSKSPAYLKVVLDALEKILPNVKQRIEFPNLDHGASGNADRGGRPDLVANELRRFFA